MNIVMLDRNTLGMDIEVRQFLQLGDFKAYDAASIEDCKEWIKEAQVIIFNKTPMNEEVLKEAKNVKLLCITATGYDNVDLEYISKRGIVLSNVRGYSTAAVVQHTFSLALYIIEKLAYYDEYVKSGAYSKQNGFSNFSQRYYEVEGKTWGIVGLGEIGKGVAKVAEALGAHVVYYSTTGHNIVNDYEQVDWKDLLAQSDIISIHCPLNEGTRQLFNLEAFSQMKREGILINVARGGVINESDLCYALEHELIAGAGLDVLSKEPMEVENPLWKIKDSTKLIITPHMAWASVEARNRCVEEVYLNIKSYINGRKRNIIE